MNGAIVGSGGDALSKEAIDSGRVNTLRVGGIAEATFVGEGDCGKPLQDVLALSETTLGPLGGVVVCIDETGDDELGRGEIVKGCGGGVSRG